MDPDPPPPPRYFSSPETFIFAPRATLSRVFPLTFNNFYGKFSFIFPLATISFHPPPQMILTAIPDIQYSVPPIHTPLK